MLRRPQDAHDEHLQLIDSHGNFHELFESTIQDVFRKFDMLLNRELSFTEFRGFFECIGKNLTESEFKNDILEKYCSTTRGITFRGFKDFWHNSINSYGEQTIWSWLENLGYDRDLYSVRSRVFVLTLHCESELAVTVRDSIQTDLDN